MTSGHYSRLVGTFLVIAGFVAGWFLHGRPGNDQRHDAPLPDAASAVKSVETWTCSMHPQIALPKPGKCPICFMDLIPLEAEDHTGDVGLRELSVSEHSLRLLDIETTAVERRSVMIDVRLTGTVGLDETRVASITARFPGRFERLFVHSTGVPINKGEHIAELYSPELRIAQEELLQTLETSRIANARGISAGQGTGLRIVDAVREKLRLWGMNQGQIDEIEKRGTVTDRMTIYSPMSGIVIENNAREGRYVETGDRIFSIADLKRLWVNLDAYETDLGWLRYGQAVRLITPVQPGESLEGIVSLISPVLEGESRTVKVRVVVSNKDGRLKPGMFVKGIVSAELDADGHALPPRLSGTWICPMHPDISKDTQGTCDICGMSLVSARSKGLSGEASPSSNKPLVVPASSLLLTGKRAIVYVQVPGREKATFEGREIIPGPRAGDFYVVRHGLAEGERVVTRGNFKLDAELQIRARPSMMTVGGEASGDAGHAHHGGPAPGVKAGPIATVAVPIVVRQQLQDAFSTATALLAASSTRDIASVRASYVALKSRLSAVSEEKLSGRAATIWKEYAMLLDNDCELGMSLTTIEEAVRLQRVTRGHIEALGSAFGLSVGRGDEPVSSPGINPAFREQLAAVVDVYLTLQTALANDDLSASLATIPKMGTSLSGVDMTLVEGRDHQDWMTQADRLRSLLASLSSAGDIEAIRKDFKPLSEAVDELIRRFQPMSTPVYQITCPMAFDNQGAIWLQLDDVVRNPYYGSMMLGCGDVTDVLPARGPT